MQSRQSSLLVSLIFFFGGGGQDGMCMQGTPAASSGRALATNVNREDKQIHALRVQAVLLLGEETKKPTGYGYEYYGRYSAVLITSLFGFVGII